MSRPLLPNWYEVLGAAPGADQEMLAKAWKEASFAAHPDRNLANPDEAHARFLEVTEAWAVLGNPKLRQRYDRQWRMAYGPLQAPKPSSGPRPSRGNPRDRLFDFFLKEVAAEAEAEVSASRPTSLKFEVKVDEVTRELAANRGLIVSRSAFYSHAVLAAASIGCGYALVLLLATDPDRDRATLLLGLLVLPLVALFAFVRLCVRIYRDRADLVRLRKLAEAMVRKQWKET